MSLTAPNLDDRGFQDLVDEAKRLVQQRCPEWTDHNVSDPGVTLIEAFATMVDQLIYRLNRIPERHYVRFLDLIGLRPFPATAARTDVTFWLSAPQPDTVTVHAGTEVATARTDIDEAVVFTTEARLDIPSCALLHVATESPGGRQVDRDEALRTADGLACFGAEPAVGDALLIGLSEAVPSCAVTLRVECDSQGIGVDPRHPPLVWQAWTGSAWADCELHQDGTGGLNRSGDVVVHVPAGHTAAVLAGARAGWLRCRVLETSPGQHAYRRSPVLRRLTCFTVGGTTAVVHAEEVRGELLGTADGTPGQRFPLQRGPVVPGGPPPVLEVAGGDGSRPWAAVETFAGCRDGDEVFLLDHAAGEVQLPPAVRGADGSPRRYGAVPARGAQLRLRAYRVGGGRQGNVAAGALRVLKSSIPYVDRAENRRPAGGGVDAEEMANAIARGPLLLRTRDRAVTAEDVEELAAQAAPDIRRIRCVPATASGQTGHVRVLVVPAVGGDALGRVPFERLQPEPEVLERITSFLDERRVVGTRLLVEPPYYRGVTVVAKVTARPAVDAERLRVAALEALYRYLNPIEGGPAGAGWPFGRPVQAGDVFAVLQRVPGCELVEDVLLFAADPVTGERGDPVQRIEVPPHGLVQSYEHRVRVQ